jgi:hypothetical protein
MGKLERIGGGFPNVAKFLVLGRIVGFECKAFFLNGRPFDF